jgi:transposase-like protein
VTQDDLLYRFRLRVFVMAGELGNVRAACRAMGIHPSTYYRWKRQLDRYGPEIDAKDGGGGTVGLGEAGPQRVTPFVEVPDIGQRWTLAS